MNVPNHVAIILDGNGRWAKKKRMPRNYGHMVGCDNLEKICYNARDLGIKYLTVYAFSTENWKRSKEEVDGLMNLFRRYLKRCIKSSRENEMCVRVIGEKTAFDEDIQDSIKTLEDYSENYDKLYFQIALNYGGRDEILRAVSKFSADVKAGLKSPDEITSDVFESYLDTAGIPDPDLMIRTSGEQRISNFLLWQLAYTEFYFTDVLWPDFDREELAKAIRQYNNRDRRYGAVKGDAKCSKQDY